MNFKIRAIFILILLLAIPVIAIVTTANDTASTSYNTTITINVTANDTGTNVRVGQVSTAEHGNASLNDDGTINYTANPGYIGTDTFNYTALENGLFYTGTNHYYEFVSNPTIGWADSNISALNRTLYGLQGYLATINSSGENDFIATKLTGDGWIGASDSAVEGTWRWVTGPEAGTQFWTGASGGSAVGGNYANWNDGEPNNVGGGVGEDYGEIYSSGGGQWNDLPNGAAPGGFVVEYGGTAGDSANFPNATVTITVTDPVKPQLTILSPTLPNNTLTRSNYFITNYSIFEYNLDSLILNYNTTNYTIYNSSLVLMLNLNNLSAIGENNSVIVDASRYPINATNYGATWNSTGKYGGSYTFNGINNSLNISQSTKFQSQQLTLAAWIYLSSNASSDNTIISYGQGTTSGGPINGSGESYSLGYRTDLQSFRFRLKDAEGSNLIDLYQTNSTLNESVLDQWVHIAVTWNGSQATIYVNGEQNITTTNTGTINYISDVLTQLRIGNWFGNNERWFKGNIDEIRIWDTSLNSNEIREQYQTNLAKINISNWQLNLNQTNLTNGNYTTQLFATDTSNNFNSSESRQTNIDVTAPTITITSPTNTTYAHINVSLNVQANEAIDTWWYSLNGSTNTTFTPNTTLANLAYQLHNLTVYANDTIGNIGNTTVWFTTELVDGDDDGVPNWNDTLFGNESNVNKNNVTGLNITIGGNTTNGTFSDVQNIKAYANSKLFMNFSHNFTAGSLNLSQITITMNSTYLIVNLSGQLQTNYYNKSLYLTNNNFTTLCVKNADIAEISEMSSTCTGTNETNFTTCLGSSTPITINGITCSETDGTIQIDNLTYSAVRGTQATLSTSRFGTFASGSSTKTTTSTTQEETQNTQNNDVNTQAKNANAQNQTTAIQNTPPIQQITITNKPDYIPVTLTVIIALLCVWLILIKKKKKQKK